MFADDRYQTPENRDDNDDPANPLKGSLPDTSAEPKQSAPDTDESTVLNGLTVREWRELSPGEKLLAVRQELSPVAIETLVPKSEQMSNEQLRMFAPVYGYGLKPAHVNEIFSTTGYESGSSILEVGPGLTPVSLLAALGGSQVTVVELFEPYRLRFEAMTEHFQELIGALGGSLKTISGDFLSEEVQKALGEEKFQHIICLDVINPVPVEVSQGMLRRAGYEGVTRETTDKASAGIRDHSTQQRFIELLAERKSVDSGTVYFSAVLPFVDGLEQMAAEQLFDQLEKNGIQIDNKVPVTWKPLMQFAPGACVFRVDESSPSEQPD